MSMSSMFQVRPVLTQEGAGGVGGEARATVGSGGSDIVGGGGVFDDMSWSIVEVVGKEPRL
jgi:hypothetical protein